MLWMFLKIKETSELTQTQQNLIIIWHERQNQIPWVEAQAIN